MLEHARAFTQKNLPRFARLGVLLARDNTKDQYFKSFHFIQNAK